MIDLTDKVILVTGGSRGIGAESVRQMVALGARVVVHFGSNHTAAEQLANEVGTSNVHLVQADLRSVEDTERLWREALAWQERIDVLVNNAGVYEVCSPEWELDEWLAGWERTLRINLVSAAQLVRQAVVHFRSRGGGIIINVASRAAHRGDDFQHQQYGASKAGMLALTRSIARACAKENILSYGVAPGFVDTDMVSDVIAERGREELGKMYPTGRVIDPAEVASVITFLASGIAPQTTGNTIDLSGAADVR